MALNEVAAIADPEERRLKMLERLEDIYGKAMGKCRINKHGEEVPEPDCNAATKVVQVASSLLGVEQMHGSAELERAANAAKLRLVAALERIPGLAEQPGTLERERAVLAVLRDVAVVAALKPNADVAGTVGTLRAVVQVLRIGGDDTEDLPEDELRAMTAKMLSEKVK